MKNRFGYLLSLILLTCASCQEQYSKAMIQQQLLWRETIERSNVVLKENTLSEIESTEISIKPKTQYHSFYAKFKYITTKADSVYDTIEHLKSQIIGSSVDYSSDFEMSQAELALVQNLTQSIQSMCQNNLNWMERTWDNGGVKATSFADTSKKKSMMQKIKATLDLPFIRQILDNPRYLEELLKDKPLATALTLLSLIQNDIRKQEYHTFHFFNRQISRMHDYKQVGLWAISSKQCIRLGEIFKSEIVFGHYPNKILMSISTNGDSLPIEHERAKYTIQATQVGEQAYRPLVTFLNPYTNRVDSLERIFFFEVIDSL